MCQIYNKNIVLYSSVIPHSTYNAKKSNIFLWIFRMYFGEKPFEHSDPTKQIILSLARSQNLCDMENFQCHPMTRVLNKRMYVV